MEQFFGVIQITATQNAEGSGDRPALEKVDFVHYPDCQQLSIWLPESGYNYGNMRLINRADNSVVDERPATDRLNGSIKLLWDTLDIAPGEYLVEIEHNQGWKHTISMVKYPEDAPPPPQPAPVPEPVERSEPIVYRDGFGNVIPDEADFFREKLLQEINNKFGRRIEYTGNARAGSVFYIDNTTRIEFWYEMGGGDCILYIDIPAPGQWEARTGTPPERREEILEYVAETVRQQQLSSYKWTITDTSIQYHR